MAKRKAARRVKPAKKARQRPAAPRRSAQRPTAKRRPAARKPTKKAPAPVRKKAAKAMKKAAKAKTKATINARVAPKTPVKVPRLDRARRTLDEGETLRTPPSSLDMGSMSSAARSGRAGMEHSQRDHAGMSDVTGGDPDVDVEDAYFAGEEAPGGDNPTPDQDIVEDIGKALGVTYEDNEELKGADKLVERDKHRWELDPASSDDFKDRD